MSVGQVAGTVPVLGSVVDISTLKVLSTAVKWSGRRKTTKYWCKKKKKYVHIEMKKNPKYIGVKEKYHEQRDLHVLYFNCLFLLNIGTLK